MILNITYPILTNFTNVIDIGAGQYHSLVLVNGNVFGFGSNNVKICI